MPKVPLPRIGTRVKVLDRTLQFSYWPMYREKRRFGLQSTLFALDPWSLIRTKILERSPAANQSEALSSLAQANDFYNATTTTGVIASRPLLLYYCFMNLMKAFALTVNQKPSFDRAHHGLSEKMRSANREYDDAYLTAHVSPSLRTHQLNLFDELLQSLSNVGLGTDREYDLPILMPQVVPGHRLWAEAKKERERFISVNEISIKQNKVTKEIWLEIDIFADDLSRLSVTHSQLLSETRLNTLFREVRNTDIVDGRKLIRLEQITSRVYTHRASDAVSDLVNSIKPYLWSVVTSVPPYRRYYVYLAPIKEHPQVLPQLMSIYAITFYLGSITRYRPHQFDSLIRSPIGPRIEEFITGQPQQFLYLMASEFARQDVTKPSVV